nr:hypothetical protein [uncultured Jannaschia sp.]
MAFIVVYRLDLVCPAAIDQSITGRWSHRMTIWNGMGDNANSKTRCKAELGVLQIARAHCNIRPKPSLFTPFPNETPGAIGNPRRL